MNNTNEKLKNLRSFSDAALVMGIPSKLFGACLIMSLAVMALFSKFFGAILLIAIILPLYVIHKDDEEAWSLYLSEFSSPDIYTFEIEDISPIIIIDDLGQSMIYEKKNHISYLPQAI
jgi:hypothetical protein